MALEVAEGAVVGHHLEPVAQALEAAARAVAAVAPFADQLGQHLRALVGRQRCAALSGSPPPSAEAASNSSAASRSSSPPCTDSNFTDGRSSSRCEASRPSRAAQRRRGLGALLQVGDPLAAAVRALHARHEARHRGLQLGEDHAAEVLRLRERRGEQAQQQLLIGLAGGEDAHVRERPRRQQPPQQVQRLRPDRAGVGRLGLAVRAREALRRPLLDARQSLGVGVEQEVHRLRVLRAERVVAPVAVAAARHLAVVGDVARGLLEVGRQPPALEHLRHQVRDPLACDVGAAELRHRVVAVPEEASARRAGAPARPPRRRTPRAVPASASAANSSRYRRRSVPR